MLFSMVGLGINEGALSESSPFHCVFPVFLPFNTDKPLGNKGVLTLYFQATKL